MTKFTQEQRSIILLRVKKHALRSLVLEDISNKIYNVPTPTKYYSYVNSIQSDQLETFNIELFSNFQSVKDVLDLYYRSITLPMQRYFFDLAYKSYLKEAKLKFQVDNSNLLLLLNLYYLSKNKLVVFIKKNTVNFIMKKR